MASTPRKRAVLAGVVFLGVASFAALALPKEPQPPIRESMQRIFASMQLLLPMSVNAKEFESPAQADAIRRALIEVASAAGAVSEHAKTGDQGVRFLGRSLDQEARRTARLFDEGAYESARFSILQMTEYCVECHSRSPIGRSSPLSRGFVSKERFAALDLEGRAQLQFATREFEAGLATLEALLASGQVSAAELLGPITNYLVISIRVKRDFTRPAATLRKFAGRPDLVTYLRLDVQRWIDALGSLSGRLEGPARLEDAVEILSEAREVTRYPSDRQALVHYVVASTLLQRVVEESSSAAEKARAYYLLGLSELRIGRAYWLGLPEFFLETAIRLDPAGDAALQAYALIEEETFYTYSLGIEDGSEAPELPLDVEQRLTDLRRKVETARAAKGLPK